MTAIGAIDVCRSHGYCNLCGQPRFAADPLLGIDGWLSRRARAMADRVGVCEPFRQAETLLGDLAGWKIDAETIRRSCHQDAAAARTSRAQRQTLPERLAAAAGARERHMDAGGVWEALGTLSADAAVAERLGTTAGAVLNDFCGHQGRLGYAVRLRRGQAMGSGLVEGTIKQRVNLRRKRAAARWRLEPVGPFVELLCLADSAEWAEYLPLAA